MRAVLIVNPCDRHHPAGQRDLPGAPSAAFQLRLSTSFAVTGPGSDQEMAVAGRVDLRCVVPGGVARKRRSQRHAGAPRRRRSRPVPAARCGCARRLDQRTSSRPEFPADRSLPTNQLISCSDIRPPPAVAPHRLIDCGERWAVFNRHGRRRRGRGRGRGRTR